jgi:electron transfer flavoprotein alpha subunit
MAEKNGVLVFIEQDEGKIADVSLELVCKGRELADRLSVTLSAVLCGQNVSHIADDLVAHGCDEVHLAEDHRLKHFRTLPYSRVVSQVIRKTEPQIVLFGASPVGRDLAPRIASELRAGLTADCTDLQIGDHTEAAGQREYKDLLYQIRPAFGGNIIATIVCPETRPQMATVREGVMKITPPDKSRKGKIMPVEVSLDDSDLVLEILQRQRKDKLVNLKAAHVIISGGAGVGSKEGFKLLADFAHTIGGVVGASRSAVDSGFIGKDHQVGQTGTTVRPKLYIACGISGAIQHRAGMQESAKIVAINSDPDAPIFGVAHYGIVGDLHQVIPQLIKAYRSK